MLVRLQRRIVEAQTEGWTAADRGCGACWQRRRVKDSYPIVFRTSSFGDIRLKSPRLHRCPCENNGPATLSPLTTLIPGHVAPERLHLETRWASLVPYTAAVELLFDVLPIGSGDNATTERPHVLRGAERLDAELPEERASFINGRPSECEKQRCPERRLVVGLDDFYVRDKFTPRRDFVLRHKALISQDIP